MNDDKFRIIKDYLDERKRKKRLNEVLKEEAKKERLHKKIEEILDNINRDGIDTLGDGSEPAPDPVEK